MMNFILLFKLFRDRKKNARRQITFNKLISYFLKLKMGEITGNIYHARHSTHNEIIVKNEDEVLKLLDTNLRNSLNRIRIKNTIDISNKIGLENVGFGCIIAPIMFDDMMAVTQGEAVFYFPTHEQKEYVLSVELLAIAKISGGIKFEDEKMSSFFVPTLSKKSLSIKIESKLITGKISKVTIYTNDLWYPRYLDKNFIDIPLGIGIKLIKLS